jgi:hypothetical protein
MVCLFRVLWRDVKDEKIAVKGAKKKKIAVKGAKIDKKIPPSEKLLFCPFCGIIRAYYNEQGVKQCKKLYT